MNVMLSEFLTVDEFAKACDLTTQHVYKKIRDKDVNAEKKGYVYLIPKIEVVRYKKEKHDIENKYMWADEYCEKRGISRSYFYVHKNEYETRKFEGRLYVRVKI